MTLKKCCKAYAASILGSITFKECVSWQMVCLFCFLYHKGVPKCWLIVKKNWLASNLFWTYREENNVMFHLSYPFSQKCVRNWDFEVRAVLVTLKCLTLNEDGAIPHLLLLHDSFGLIVHKLRWLVLQIRTHSIRKAHENIDKTLKAAEQRRLYFRNLNFFARFVSLAKGNFICL